MVDRGSTLRTVLVGAGLAAALIAGVLLADTLADNPGGDQTDGAAPVDVAEVGDSLALGQGGLTDQADPSVPEPLPEATLAGFDGGPQVALSSYRGSPLIVNFWATWCAPCVAEMPALQTVSEQLRGDVATKLFGDGLQGGHLRHARRAPRGPEVDDQRAAPVAR